MSADDFWERHEIQYYCTNLKAIHPIKLGTVTIIRILILFYILPTTQKGPLLG